MTVVWPFMPQSGSTESLEWLTDVIPCMSAEQRLCIRPIPRQEFIYDYILNQTQFGRAKELAKSIGGDDLYIPIWEDFTEVGALGAGVVSVDVDAARMAYELDGDAIVWGGDMDCEVVTISAITAYSITFTTTQSYSNALVLPVRTAKFAQELDTDRPTPDYAHAQARFISTITEDLSTQTGIVYPTFKTYQIVTSRSAASNSSQQFTHETEELDTESGNVWRGTLFSYSTQTATVDWFAYSRSELWNLRVWLHSRKGRWKAFWYPSWNSDLIVTKEIGSSHTTITVQDVDYDSHYPSPADFLIVSTIGNMYPVRVTDCAPGDPGEEVLTIETALGVVLPLGSVDMMCRMVLSRFDSDRVEIKHSAGSSASVSVPIVEVHQ